MTESFHTVNNYDSKEVSMGNLGYKALALDLDGTLTDSNKNLPTRNKEVLKKAMDLGLKVILISGRSVMGITGLARTGLQKIRGHHCRFQWRKNI